MLDIVEEKIDKAEQPKIKKYLSIAKNSAKTLLLMINDILDISQIQKGKLRLNMQASLIHNLIDEVLPLVAVQIQRRGLQLVYKNNCSPETLALVDPMRFQQILLNLLSNACKFTEKGTITVKVAPVRKGMSASRESSKVIKMKEDSFKSDEIKEKLSEYQELPLIIISVTDSGVGIKPEHIPELFKLFGKFEQRGNATGVGLGLAISQKLAQQMYPAGIEVKSQYGNGTRFWFYVQQTSSISSEDNIFLLDNNVEINYNISARDFGSLISLPNQSKNFGSSNFDNKNSNLSMQKIKPRILIVDDDQINHIVISKYLSSFNFATIAKAFNGQEAIETIEKYSKNNIFFDFILMDCNMPIMDGFTATRKIKKMVYEGKLPEINIIALTANVSASDRKTCHECGMSNVWSKPLHKKDFESKISVLISALPNFTRETK